MARKLQLFDVERARNAPRSTGMDLVPLERRRCLRCGADVRLERVGQLALFRHGGYGATQMSTFELCSARKCRGVRLANVVEVNPREGRS